MRPLSKAVKKVISEDPFYRVCFRKHEGDCYGNVQMDHVFKYAGRQIDEAWAILPTCYRHHILKLDRPYSEYIALGRVTDEQLTKYPKKDWQTLRTYLNSIYLKDV